MYHLRQVERQKYPFLKKKNKSCKISEILCSIFIELRGIFPISDSILVDVWIRPYLYFLPRIYEEYKFFTIALQELVSSNVIFSICIPYRTRNKEEIKMKGKIKLKKL